MVKIRIRRTIKKTKPIKLVKSKEFIFKKRPMIINYIPKVSEKKVEEKTKPQQSQINLQNLQNLPINLKFPEQRKRKISFDGVHFPEIKTEIKPIEKKFKKEELTQIDIKYPLIPRKPGRNDEIFAYAHIYWDKENSELRYDVIEPELTENDKKLLEMFKDYIREKIDIDFAAVKKFEAKNYLFKKIDDALDYYKVELPEVLIKVFRYYVNRDFLGLNKIEPLLQDEHLEDISCDGVNVTLYVVHRDPRFGSIKTNIVFENAEELDSFVMKLAQRCGKDISMAHPLLNGILPDNSRVQATLATDIARKGSNFTIRKFSKEPFTPTMQILYNTIDVKLMAYIWFAIENGRSILISGGTGSGKTSFLNSVSMLVKPQEKIVSIEDTGELQLPHPNWIPEVARETIGKGGRGSVTLFDLLRESMRQRPDRLVVGEVRGKEAFVLFQAMATGHPGLATIHSESIETLVDRLITPPIDLPVSLLETLDLVVFISRVKMGDKIVRRITSIDEIVAIDYKGKRPITNTFSVWDPKKDEFKIKNKSSVLKKIIDRTGISKKDMEEDIRDKAKVLEWLAINKIVDYKTFGKYVAQYNSNPDKFFKFIEKNKWA
jgi:flagellar protein FlaI